LRPEAFGALVHHAISTGTNPYCLDKLLFQQPGLEVLEWNLMRNEEQAVYYPEKDVSTYLLGQMYPEGSPAHPSYPAGHGTVAGACVTVIKAFFNDQTKIKDLFTPVKVDPNDPKKLIPLHCEGEDDMTVGSELDKLASNIALARDFGGVHYRSDSEEGVLLGEKAAIKYLQDHARTYAEEGFKGFELTTRRGIRIRITPEKIIVIKDK
jgi:hypothetical protein